MRAGRGPVPGTEARERHAEPRSSSENPRPRAAQGQPTTRRSAAGRARDRSAQRLPCAPLMSLPWQRLMGSMPSAVGTLVRDICHRRSFADQDKWVLRNRPGRQFWPPSGRKSRSASNASRRKRRNAHDLAGTDNIGTGPAAEPPRRASFICSTRSSTLVSARRWASALCWLCLPVLVA